VRAFLENKAVHHLLLLGFVVISLLFFFLLLLFLAKQRHEQGAPVSSWPLVVVVRGWYF
jgi:hypothetical protein